MKITKLEKKKRLYLLELDETEKLYVTEDTIVRFFLTKGKAVTQEELEEIKTFAQFSYGKNLALYHLSFKQRTTKEVRDYLTKHEIDPTISEQVIATLIQDNWLDDERYARQVIDNNLHSGDKGAYMLKQKLAQKGLPDSLLNHILSQYDFTEVCERAAQKLLRKYEGKLPRKALQNKLTQGLLNKGFSFSEANSTITQLPIENKEEEEFDLLMAAAEKLLRKYEKTYDGYQLKQRLTQALARKGYDFSTISQALRELL